MEAELRCEGRFTNPLHSIQDFLRELHSAIALDAEVGERNQIPSTHRLIIGMRLIKLSFMT